MGSFTATTRAQKSDDLPSGRGREILETSCTTCHDLEEVTKLRGKLDRAGWLAIVKTMIEYGAAVDSKDTEVLVDYLAQHLGKRQS